MPEVEMSLPDRVVTAIAIVASIALSLLIASAVFIVIALVKDRP